MASATAAAGATVPAGPVAPVAPVGPAGPAAPVGDAAVQHRAHDVVDILIGDDKIDNGRKTVPADLAHSAPP